MTKEQIERRKALHEGMDEGKRYLMPDGGIVYRDDSLECGPYVYTSTDGLEPVQMVSSWNEMEWEELPPEPKWFPSPDELVLVRPTKESTWTLNRFSHYEKHTGYPYRCYSMGFAYIASYHGNENFLGKMQEPKGMLF